MNIENQKHGFGKLITKKYTLIGTWRKNKFTGWGRETDNNENYLEAKFIKEKFLEYKGEIISMFYDIETGKVEIISKR